MLTMAMLTIAHLLGRPHDRVAEEAELRESLAPAQLGGQLIKLVVAEAQHLKRDQLLDLAPELPIVWRESCRTRLSSS